MDTRTLRTAVVELAGGRHARVSVLEADDGEPGWFVVSRSYRDGARSLFDPETDRVVLPASALPDLRAALAELDGED